jgi:hypothetical protein
MTFKGADGKLSFGGQSFNVTEWSADIIAPPVFYFEGKPFEMNAAGIYVPACSCEPFSQPIDWSNATTTVSSSDAPKITMASVLSSVEKMKAAAEKHITTSLFDNSGLWKPLVDSSIGNNHQKMLDTGKLFDSYKTVPIPDGNPISIHTMFEHVFIPPPIHVTFAGLIASMLSARIRRFIIEHDDSHLFTREPTMRPWQQSDEQHILRAIHGGGDWVWSETLKAHVRVV